MRLQFEIAQNAAAWVLDHGLDFGAAKRQAVKALGLPQRTALPDNVMVEQAVREHISLFCAEEQAADLCALRQLALHWIQALNQQQSTRSEPSTAYVTGATWHGTANRLSTVALDWFCADTKLAEMALMDVLPRMAVLNSDVAEGWGLRPGETVTVYALTLKPPVLQWQLPVGLHISLQPFDALRGALQPDALGRKPRGTAHELQALLEQST